MNYKSLFRNSALIIAASMLTLAACKRNNNSAPALTSSDDNGGYASDQATLERTSNDVISIADVAAAGNGSTLRTTSVCASVIFDTTGSGTHTMTVNFGSADCLCADGKTRRGEIIVTYSGRYKDSASTHTITYNSYYVNDNKVSGSKQVTNEGANSSGQVWYDVVLNDSIALSSDSVISWTAHRTRTWLTGYPTTTMSDDSYAIADAAGSGGTVLTRANGHVFTFTITTPIVVAYNCDYIESGIVDISSTTFTGGDRIVDYSYSLTTPGSCDDVAKLTIGTHTYTIYLH